MSTATLPPPAFVPQGAVAPPPVQPENRIVLDAASWHMYVAIGDVLGERSNVRVTYDRGRLEVMTLSHPHEWLKNLFGRLVETTAEEAGTAIQVGGQMTFRDEERDRGFEPDQCYWITNEPRMRVPHEWRPAADPPPDLIVEVEVSRSALPRLDIFAAYGVPEIWRFDGQSIRVHLLQPDGTYAESERSPTFPAVPMADIAMFLVPDPTADYLAIVRRFRTWVRARLTQQTSS
ncbi:MAG: Uma2 family endonuclease [Gemmataceae bacterium]